MDGEYTVPANVTMGIKQENISIVLFVGKKYIGVRQKYYILKARNTFAVNLAKQGGVIPNL